MNFARAVATVGGLTLLSRLAGFARDVLTAALLGAGPVADAFFVALKLPNLFRRLFAEGAFTVAFVPLFSAELQSRGRAAAQAFAGEALAVLLAVLLPVTAAAVVLAPGLIAVLAPGFTDDALRFATAVDYARLTLPYLMLVSLVALLGGILNGLDRFGPFAAAPIAFNLTLVAGLAGARALGMEPGRAMAAAVTVAGALQLVWLAAACRSAGITVRLPQPRLTPRVRRLLAVLGPGALGAGIVQVNLFVNVVLASLLPAGAVSALYYADRLNQLPLGVIGTAVGTALLPVLARRAAAGDRDGLRAHLSRGLEFGIVLGLPAAIALAMLAEPIIRVLFERGAFGPAETRATAAALAAYAAGIPAYVMAKVLGAAFFARHDTASPVRAAAAAAMANAGLGLALSGPLGTTGIALATGLSAWVNLGVLALALRRRGWLDLDARLRGRTPRVALACLAMGAALLPALPMAEAWIAQGPGLLRFATLGALVLLGIAVFLAAARALGAVDLAELRGLLAREPAA
ncbi:murein biosynthesis integral membrane protein MurJ [Arenibaculum pallidiluteum]|uniref:murein biosynthesis integral membrane protein MurJ n=1 Tax=Arenibaculum pallidiluteum TaxID=2812559 RepID=UPI001A9793FF|nr:murein biosynthesis integral membrane protein MurJ [Arenibaculum pallidiluteum]